MHVPSAGKRVAAGAFLLWSGATTVAFAFSLIPHARVVDGGEGVEIAWETPTTTSQARLFWTDLASTEPIPSVFPAYRQGLAIAGEGPRHRVVVPIGRTRSSGSPPARKAKALPLGRTIHYRVACIAKVEGRARQWRSADYQMRLVGSPDGRVVMGLTFTDPPVVANVLGDGAVISWRTNKAAKAYLRYWDNARPGAVRTVRNENAARGFEMELGGLEAEHVYGYEVICVSRDRRDAIRSPKAQFRAAVRSNGHFRFAVLSGSQGDPSRDDPDADVDGVNVAAVGLLAHLATRRDAQFLAVAGNLIAGEAPDLETAERRYRTWKQAVRRIHSHVPIYACMGGGEATSPHRSAADEKLGTQFAEDVWRSEFVLPDNAPLPLRNRPPYLENVYSFDYGNCHFIFLNTNYRQLRGADAAAGWSHTIDARQQRWLANDLAASAGKLVFAFFHEPAYPSGGEPGRSFDRIPANRNLVWQMLDKAACVAVFSGHAGHYSRLAVDNRFEGHDTTHRIWQVICGRAGGPGATRNRRFPWIGLLEGYSEGDHYVLVDVRGRLVEFSVFDGQDRQIDRWEIRARRSAPVRVAP